MRFVALGEKQPLMASTSETFIATALLATRGIYDDAPLVQYSE